MTPSHRGKSVRALLSAAAICVALSHHSIARGAHVEYFDLTQVRLREGPFQHAQELDRNYLLALEADRLLSGFRSEAGLAPKAPKYPNWESSGLDGHTLGHYLTALAQMWAATGDAECRRRLDYTVGELAECQRANGNGYVGAVPNGRVFWEAIKTGTFDAQGFSLQGAWVPWYNVHKTFAGLRDAWLIGGNAQARDVLIGLSDWCGNVVGGLSDEKMQVMLRAEHGGMNEVLADVFAITGDRKYLALAARFSHRAILEPLLRHQDELTGKHANTQIPKAVGFARIAELGGEASWREAAAFFWETVAERRSVAFGGNSVREHFNPANDFGPMLESREGPESCNTYNMLRLTEVLFRTDTQARYADFYERALYNHILSTQHPKSGGFVYFTPIRPQHYRVYSQPTQCFWCCVGSGLENHGKYGRFIYAHEGTDALWVNLFIASELDWPQAGLRLTQETKFPDEPRVTLTLRLAAPRTFALRVRHPGWVNDKEGLNIRVNGRPVPADSAPASYATVSREWRDGDRVEIELPMRTTLERLPDGSDYVAVVHGPIVLAAETEEKDLDGLVAGDARMGHVAPGPYRPLDEAPMLIGSFDSLAEHIRSVADQPLTFEARDLIQPARFREVRLVPFFRIHDARYMLYWRVAAPEQYEGIVTALAVKEREHLELERRTVDHVTPGQQQPEVEHNFRGENTGTGANAGRTWRDASGWFGYDLKAVDETALELRLTTFSRDRGGDFTIVVNGREIASTNKPNTAGEQFAESRFAVPAETISAGQGGVLRLEFRAKPGSRVPALYEVRLVRAQSGE